MSIGVGEYCNGTRNIHDGLILLFSVIDSNTHTFLFTALCALSCQTMKEPIGMAAFFSDRR